MVGRWIGLLGQGQEGPKRIKGLGLWVSRLNREGVKGNILHLFLLFTLAEVA